MFKKQTFSSWQRKLDFSSGASSRIHPKPIFIIPVLRRCTHALHISIFFACECMHNSKNLVIPVLRRCTRALHISILFARECAHESKKPFCFECMARRESFSKPILRRGKCPFNKSNQTRINPQTTSVRPRYYPLE